MRIGLSFPASTPISTPEVVAQVAAAAEQLGFAGIWIGEHVVSFRHYASKHPYYADGAARHYDGQGQLEQFQTLTYIAAHTERLRLGTGVTLVPQRDPIYLAKAVATLDWLSKGRAALGAGIGWNREEFDALGVPWDRRGQRCREYVSAMRSLWTDEISAYSGEMYQLAPCMQNPKPVQAPHPPIYFGGESDAALKRVADLGQGWYGVNLDPGEVSSRMTRLRQLLGDGGRDPDSVDIVIGMMKNDVDGHTVRAYGEAGVHELVFTPRGRTAAQLVAALETLAGQLIESAPRPRQRGASDGSR